MIAVEAIVIDAGQGRQIPRPVTHGAVTVKVAGAPVTVFETSRAAGDDGGPALHSHPAFDETFYVVAGEWEFVAGDRIVVASSGSVVHVPRGLFHSFRSTGRLDGKLVGIAAPGGIEDFFEEAAAKNEDREVGHKHGIEFA